MDWERLEHWEVHKMPLGDAATNWSDYLEDPSRQRMYRDVSRIRNLYQVSRTGLDKTIYAGLMAAESIREADRELFLGRTSPEERQPWLVGG